MKKFISGIAVLCLAADLFAACSKDKAPASGERKIVWYLCFLSSFYPPS
jgi:hypothetical protein